MFSETVPHIPNTGIIIAMAMPKNIVIDGLAIIVEIKIVIPIK